MYQVKCERRIYKTEPNTHSHSYGQLILPLQGLLNIETNKKNLILTKEQIFFLPPDCSHTFYAAERNEFLVLDISQNLLHKKDMLTLSGGSVFPFDDKWKAVRYLLLNEAEYAAYSNSLNNLFHYCYPMISKQSIPRSIAYINEHFCESIDMRTLAEIEHYNVSYYSEWFQNQMNISPLEYIQALRIKKAKELLLHTSFTILQISSLVGYEYNSSFTRRFKTAEGISPAAYRKKFK